MSTLEEKKNLNQNVEKRMSTLNIYDMLFLKTQLEKGGKIERFYSSHELENAKLVHQKITNMINNYYRQLQINIMRNNILLKKSDEKEENNEEKETMENVTEKEEKNDSVQEKKYNDSENKSSMEEITIIDPDLD